ncbi:hypothetical protein [Methanobacterium sp. MBAC-LM]|jgi:hypothetical protein|uniref:hypothetical protein n=1 Tax=Methanobacterium sp. MBAC-LM TaxID=3412034 RepID=UPI003C725CA4
MPRKKLHFDENALKLIKKCEDKEVDTTVMGACRVLLEEMDRGDIGFTNEDRPDESYIEMAQNIKPEDVPKVLIMAFKIKERNKIEPELKIAANRLIRAIEAL